MLAAGLLAAVLSRLRQPGVALASAALLVAGAAAGSARLGAIDRAAEAPSGWLAPSHAHLLERPRPSRFGSSAPIELLDGPGRGARVLARASPDLHWPSGGRVGAELNVSGVLRPPRASTGSGFDWPAHLRRRGMARELDLSSLGATGARRRGLAGAVDSARTRAEGALGAGLSPERAALSRGMVLGQDERISELVRDDFRRSGLAHLLAVSGQNVMLLGALALPFLAAAGLGPRARILTSLALIAIYVPLAGAGPSLQRAGVMGAAGLVALAAGRPASRWYALLLAAAVTLAHNPRVAAEAGWQLSFAAVIGIMALAPAVRVPLRGLPRPLAEGAAVTVAATVATAPLMAHHFGVVSLAGLPANLMALPAVAPVMWIGMLQAAVAQAGALGAPADDVTRALATALGAVNDLLLSYLRWLAGYFAEAPGARLELPLSSPGAVVLGFAAIGLAALAIRAVATRFEPWFTSGAAEWRRLPRTRRWAAGAAAAIAVVVAWVAATGPGDPPGRLTVSFLDVGQGDATLVQDPDGSAVLFDGGPAEARVARLLERAGVRSLSIVVLTHQSADHHGGLLEVLQRFPVEVLLDGSDGNLDPEVKAILGEADRRGVRRVAARAGQAFRAGRLTIRILAPPPRSPGPAPEDPNARAVTAVVSAGDFDLFLSGDAESPSLASLALPDVEAMKVPPPRLQRPGATAASPPPAPDRGRDRGGRRQRLRSSRSEHLARAD